MTGYRGRAGLYELLTVSDAARAVHPPGPDMRASCASRRCRTACAPCALAGAMKVAEGVTTIDEVLRCDARLGVSSTPAWQPGATCKPHRPLGHACLESLRQALRSRGDTQVKIKSQRDFWSGLMFVAVGLAFAWGATNYSFGTSARPGPGYFPFGLGMLMAMLGAFVLFKALTIETDGGDPIGAVRLEAAGLTSSARWPCSAGRCRTWAC